MVPDPNTINSARNTFEKAYELLFDAEHRFIGEQYHSERVGLYSSACAKIAEGARILGIKCSPSSELKIISNFHLSSLRKEINILTSFYLYRSTNRPDREKCFNEALLSIFNIIKKTDIFLHEKIDETCNSANNNILYNINNSTMEINMNFSDAVAKLTTTQFALAVVAVTALVTVVLFSIFPILTLLAIFVLAALTVNNLEKAGIPVLNLIESAAVGAYSAATNVGNAAIALLKKVF